jgi:hypothetical protein
MNLRIETRTRLIELAGTMFFSDVFQADIEKQRALIEEGGGSGAGTGQEKQ